jgi:hypothetical protein
MLALVYPPFPSSRRQSAYPPPFPIAPALQQDTPQKPQRKKDIKTYTHAYRSLRRDVCCCCCRIVKVTPLERIDRGFGFGGEGRSLVDNKTQGMPGFQYYCSHMLRLPHSHCRLTAHIVISLMLQLLPPNSTPPPPLPRDGTTGPAPRKPCALNAPKGKEGRKEPPHPRLIDRLNQPRRAAR